MDHNKTKPSDNNIIIRWYIVHCGTVSSGWTLHIRDMTVSVLKCLNLDSKCVCSVCVRVCWHRHRGVWMDQWTNECGWAGSWPPMPIYNACATTTLIKTHTKHIYYNDLGRILRKILSFWVFGNIFKNFNDKETKLSGGYYR